MSKRALGSSAALLAMGGCFFGAYDVAPERSTTSGSGGVAGDSDTRSSSGNGGGGGTAGGGAVHGTKWHPGVYLWSGKTGCLDNELSDDLVTMSQIAGDPAFRGIEVVLDWSCLEKTKKEIAPDGGVVFSPDYEAGLALVGNYVDEAKQHGIQLMLTVNTFSAAPCTGDAGTGAGKVNLPDELYERNLIEFCFDPERSWAAKLWVEDGMQKLIALGKVYAAAFDEKPNLEMFSFVTETGAFYGVPEHGWTSAGAIAQMKSFFDAAKDDWKHTLVRNPVNLLTKVGDSDAFMASILDETAGPRVVFGGPDTFPESQRRIRGNLVFRGRSSSDGSKNDAFTDYRRKRPWLAHVSKADLCGGSFCDGDAPTTLADIASYGREVMLDSYVVWATNGDANPTPITADDVRTFVRSGQSEPALRACFAGDEPCDERR